MTEAVEDFLDATPGRLLLAFEACRKSSTPSSAELDDDVKVLVLAPDDAVASGGNGMVAPGDV